MAAADPATATSIVNSATTAVVAAADAVTTAVAKGQRGLSFDTGPILGIADIVSLALLLLIPLGVAALFTAFSMSLSQKVGAMAVANERSSHKEPTPRLGGIGYFVPIMLTFGILKFDPGAFYGPAWGLPPAFVTLAQLVLICGVFAFLVGLMDDLLRLPAIFKLIGQIAVAVLFVYMGSKLTYTVTGEIALESGRLHLTPEKKFSGVGFSQIALTGGLVLDGFWNNWFPTLGKWTAKVPEFSVLMTVLWIVIIMNVYNFMDGTDGLAAAFVIAVAAGVFVTWIPEADQISQMRAHICFIMAYSMILIGVSLGFLFYNRPPARVFLGDCGSQFIGFMLAAFLAQLTLIENQPAIDLLGKRLEIAVARRAHVDFLACLILVWPFLYDVLYTLVRRTLRFKPIWRAHHEHLYQRLNDLGWTHGAILRFSVPFYFIHAALFYAYCWAPNDRMRLTWALIALLPMIGYTVTVIACERTARMVRAAGLGGAEPPSPPEEKPAAEDDKAPAETTDEGTGERNGGEEEAEGENKTATASDESPKTA